MADTLDDLCPVCGDPIKDGDEWTIVDGAMVHEACANDSTLDIEEKSRG